jgi:long-chain acyl-CoA synthetase
MSAPGQAKELPPMDLEDLRFVYDLSIYNCQHFGSYPALTCEDLQQGQVRVYTNIEIAREATQLAAGLRSLGVQKGDRVIVMMLNSPEVITSYQAIARAGAVIIPVLPLLKAPEIGYIAQNSAAKVIITSPLLLPLVQAALAAVATVRYVVVVGDVERQGEQAGRDVSRPYGVVAYREVVERGAGSADDYMGDLVEGLSQDDTAVILYTSGTTGNPKGVELSHRNIVSNAIAMSKNASLEYADRAEGAAVTRSDEVGLAVLPLAHAYGLTMSNAAYLNGMAVVMLPRFDTTAVFSAIERYHVTGFAGVPAMFVALLYTPDAEKYDTSSLRLVGSGSAPLPLAVLEAFEQKFGVPINEGYGLSEATTVVTAHSLSIPRRPGSVGKAVQGVEVQIFDENDTPLPAGEIGEVVVRGPGIMKGYYNMPDASREALRNGWLHTGDMGRMDEDGYLYIVERKKDLIIRGGLNIYPRDVEEVLNGHPDVIESAVVGVPSERMGEEVKAFVVTSRAVDAEALKAYCRERLANYKTPSEIEFVNSLPRNAIGKIDKKQLRNR